MKYDESAATRAEVAAFYRKHNPANLTATHIESVLRCWRGKEGVLIRELHGRYKVPYNPDAETRASSMMP